jgi:hypothetical protein
METTMDFDWITYPDATIALKIVYTTPELREIAEWVEASATGNRFRDWCWFSDAADAEGFAERFADHVIAVEDRPEREAPRKIISPKVGATIARLERMGARWE